MAIAFNQLGPENKNRLTLQSADVLHVSHEMVLAVAPCTGKNVFEREEEYY